MASTIDSGLLAFEHRNRLRLAVLGDLEVLLLESANRRAMGIDHVQRHVHQPRPHPERRHIAAALLGLTSRLRIGLRRPACLRQWARHRLNRGRARLRGPPLHRRGRLLRRRLRSRLLL